MRLVCNGNQVDPRGMSTRETVVKTVSVRLLDLIASVQGLKVLCGDIGNAFIHGWGVAVDNLVSGEKLGLTKVDSEQ